MSPAILREILTARRGRVPVATLRASAHFGSEESFRDALAFLVDVGLAVDHGDTVQAVRGCGKLVADPPRVKVERTGQRPLGQLPKMSERCQAGGLQNGVHHRARQDAIIERVISRLEAGVPRRLLADITTDRMWRWKTTRPTDYRRILEAEERGKVRGVAA